jgi:hypothetical protein
LSENALKLNYGNVEFQNFQEDHPLVEGEARVEEGEEGTGRGWGGSLGRGGREGLMEREGMDRWEKGGEGRGIWTPDVPDISTPLLLITGKNICRFIRQLSSQNYTFKFKLSDLFYIDMDK